MLSCLGCALVAYKMLMELSYVAETLAESELMDDLRINAESVSNVLIDFTDSIIITLTFSKICIN